MAAILYKRGRVFVVFPGVWQTLMLCAPLYFERVLELFLECAMLQHANAEGNFIGIHRVNTFMPFLLTKEVHLSITLKSP